MLEDLEFDDSRLARDRPGAARRLVGQVRDHIKIAHHHLLVPSADGDDYSGVYWTGTDMAVVEDLGPDPEEAIDEFRAYLQEHDET